MSEWTKPSLWSVLVVLGVLTFLGVLVVTGRLTVGEGAVGALLSLLTWITQGPTAKPPPDLPPVDLPSEATTPTEPEEKS